MLVLAQICEFPEARCWLSHTMLSQLLFLHLPCHGCFVTCTEGISHWQAKPSGLLQEMPHTEKSLWQNSCFLATDVVHDGELPPNAGSKYLTHTCHFILWVRYYYLHFAVR